MFLESFECADSDALTMTMRTFIDIFSHFLPYFLWFMLDWLHYLSAFTTIKSNFTTFRIEVVLTFFSEWWDIHEISVSGRHTRNWYNEMIWKWVIIASSSLFLWKSECTFMTKSTKSPSFCFIFGNQKRLIFGIQKTPPSSSNSFGFLSKISSTDSQNIQS